MVVVELRRCPLSERATGEITARIAAVNSSCSTVAASIASIVKAMHNVDSLSQAISGCVNDQYFRNRRNCRQRGFGKRLR